MHLLPSGAGAAHFGRAGVHRPARATHPVQSLYDSRVRNHFVEGFAMRWRDTHHVLRVRSPRIVHLETMRMTHIHLFIYLHQERSPGLQVTENSVIYSTAVHVLICLIIN